MSKENENQNEKSNPWGKILKLFIEFVVAAVTAFATAKTGNAMGIW